MRFQRQEELPAIPTSRPGPGVIALCLYVWRVPERGIVYRQHAAPINKNETEIHP